MGWARSAPKPAPRIKGRIRKEYEATRQGWLEERFNRINVNPEGTWVQVKCECESPHPCPRALRCEIRREVRGGEREGATSWFHYTTTGHVHHLQPRSRRPDLRNDPGNLRLLSEACHRKAHGGA